MGHVLIDVHQGELTLKVGDEQVKFNLSKSLQSQGDKKED